MLDRIIKIFQKVEEDNNTYAKEFLDFYKQCIETFPRTLRTELGNKSINPCIYKNGESDPDKYYLTFTLSDLLWWEEKIEIDPLYFKEPKVLKREITQAALAIYDELQIPDEKYREYTKELIGVRAD